MIDVPRARQSADNWSRCNNGTAKIEPHSPAVLGVTLVTGDTLSCSVWQPEDSGEVTSNELQGVEFPVAVFVPLQTTPLQTRVELEFKGVACDLISLLGGAFRLHHGELEE